MHLRYCTSAWINKCCPENVCRQIDGFVGASSIYKNELEVCKSTCTNMNRSIMLKGEGILLANLDKYMEVSTCDPGEHVLSMVSGASGDSS